MFVALAALTMIAGCGSPTSSSSGWSPAPIRPVLNFASTDPFQITTAAIPWNGGFAWLGKREISAVQVAWYQPLGAPRAAPLGSALPSYFSAAVFSDGEWASYAIDTSGGSVAYAVVWTGTRFVAGRTVSGTTGIWHSVDGGLTWSHSALDASAWPAVLNQPPLYLSGMVYGNGRYLITGANNAQAALVATSSTGTDWQPVSTLSAMTSSSWAPRPSVPKK